MKKALIIYQDRKNEKAMEFVKQNFEEIFGDYIQFSICFLSDLEEDTILDADVYLVSSEKIYLQLQDHVADFSKTLYISRRPDRGALMEISEIPPNTNVLVVNDCAESAMDTVYDFFSIGISHVNLIAYDEELAHTGIYDDIEIAITPAESHLVPKHIKKIIDIGYRKVSFYTMFNLMKMMDLDIDAINRNMFHHIQSIVEPYPAFHANYVYSFLKSEMLNRLANKYKISMVLIDKNYQTVFANSNALRVFQCHSKTELDLTNFIDPSVLRTEDSLDTPIDILGEQYYYNKFTISLMDETVGYYITLQEERDIALANRKNKEKGLFAKYRFKDIIHQSANMAGLIDTARQIALTDHTVLIRGESGTGKELIAQSIHNASHRSKFPFVAVNCASLPDNLLESELFGYTAGAFTGAQSKGKVGLFELANHGTIFLDEIGDISPKMQSRLLRTIQERQIMKVGSETIIDLDIRLIAATNKNLELAVKEGTFRSDLFFRLNVLPLVIPPLRERKEDILLLFQNMLKDDYNNITREDAKYLQKYDWLGNVRELENVATYYHTLHRLPEFIMQQPGKAELPPCQEDVECHILKIISENATISHGVGKNHLRKELMNRGFEISDAMMRKLLNELQDKNLIFIGKGRYGTGITPEGLAQLKKKTEACAKQDI